MAESTLQFWLSFNNQAERLRLPVNPERLSISSGHSYQDISVVDLGEFTVIGDGTLDEISFASQFPAIYNPAFCEYSPLPNPWTAVYTLKRWKDSGNPMRLTITGTPINLACTIRDFNYDEVAGSPGDIYFEISFKEYKFIKLRNVEEVSQSTVATSQATQRPDTRQQPKTYTVVSGDSLWRIAEKIYGNGSRYTEIANKNGIKAPYTIYPGQVLSV